MLRRAMNTVGQLPVRVEQKYGVHLGDHLLSKTVLALFLNGLLAACNTSVVNSPTLTPEAVLPLADQMKEQLKNQNPLAIYDTSPSRTTDESMKEIEKKPEFGKFIGSQAIIGFDFSEENPKPISSEVLSFENGSYVIFYDENGNALSEVLPVSLNYGQDGSGNLSMTFKASIEDNEGQNHEESFLTFFSNIPLSSFDKSILEKAMSEDPKVRKEALDLFSKIFGDIENIDEVQYSNLLTEKSLILKKERKIDWKTKLSDFLKFLRPVSHVQAAGLTPTALPDSEPPAPVVPPLPAEAQTWVAAHPEFNLSGNLDASGFHVNLGVDPTTGKDKIIDVLPGQIATRIKVGQEGALQVYSETGDKIIAAYDPETKAWIDRDNVVAKDVFNMETYIHVQTWDQAKEIWRLEKHFMVPFPKGTSFPILSEQQADYQRSGAVRGTLGNPQPGSEPTLLFNGVVLEKGEGREGDYGLITEQINNVDDTFSAGHFGRTSSKFSDTTLKNLLNDRDRSYIVPIYQESKLSTLQKIKSAYPFIYKMWKDAGLYDGEGLVYKGIRDFVVQWLTTGKFPKELEHIILFDYIKYYDYPDHN